jgi:hypothetical protein
MESACKGNLQTGSGNPPNVLFNGYRGSFPGVKLTVVKCEWKYTSASLYVFVAWKGAILTITG